MTYLAVCLKSVKVCPYYVWCPLKNISFVCADYGSTIALDLQQTLKIFLHSSKEQMALRSWNIALSWNLYFEVVIFQAIQNIVF